jgi:hypothetical protein
MIKTMEHTSIFKIFSFLILLSLLALPVSAVTITFSELNVDWGTNQEIMVYDGMGQLVQIANTSASIVLDDNISSYLFVFRPTQDVWFQNPMNAFELIKLNFGPLVSFVLFIAVVLGLLAVVLGIFWRR